MIDLASIITTGGVILFLKALCQIKEDVLGKVIDGFLYRKTQLQLGSMRVQWIMINELGLIFVVAYQEIFFIQYIDVLLKMLQTQFKTIPDFEAGVEEVMKMWQLYCEKRNEKDVGDGSKTIEQPQQQLEATQSPDEGEVPDQKQLSKAEIIKMKMQKKSGAPQEDAKSPVDSRSPKQSVIMNTNVTKKQLESLDFTSKDLAPTTSNQENYT